MIKTALAVVTLCVLLQLSVQRSDVLPQEVIDYFGSRVQRYHHFLWHQLRENWLKLDASTQHAIAKLGWAPPRPSIAYGSDGKSNTLEDNGSGEDFLYMHRQMIAKVNEMVKDTEYEKVVGWKRVPYPGDPKWPVPPAYTTVAAAFTAFIAQCKTDDFFWSTIQPLNDKLDEPEYLRSVSLGKLGAILEYTIHTYMHIRFSDIGPEGMGLRSNGANPTPEIDTKWDNTSYQWLGDTYGSHVNPVFWKIHGWVDDHIEKWRVANGLDEIEWTNTWESGPWATYTDLFAAGEVTDGDDDMASEEDMIAEMQHVSRILTDAGYPGGMKIDVRTSLTPDGVFSHH